MKTYVFIALLLIGLFLFLITTIPGDASEGKAQHDGYKVMLLGFDGLDPEFMDNLLSQGKLPNFERLMREGAYAPCLTFKPTKSVVVWTSIATGKRMEKHGIIDWMLLSEDKKERVLATGNVRRTEALWNMTTTAGKGAQIINWWATWPAEQIQGEIVSNHYPKPKGNTLEEATFPAELVQELESLREITRDEAEGIMRGAGIPVYDPEVAEATFRPSENFRREFRASVGHFVEDMLVERVSHHLLDTRGQKDLFAVIFRNPDIFSHFLWRFIDRRIAERVFEQLMDEKVPLAPDVENAMNEAYARVLEPVYIHEDRRLGRMLERAGPDTVVIVASDHGFQFRPYGFYHYGLDVGGGTLAPPGVIFLWGPPIRAGARLSAPTVFDITPTVLHLMGLPVGRDMDGRVLTEAIIPQLLAERRVAWVDSHDSGARGGEPMPSPIQDDILDELRTLGYVR
jgi:predicted AlkP superfamily phosphohydrolase/phosphomutase